MSPYEDAMSAHLAQDEPPILTPRDPANPAEDEMTPNDDETYREEQSK